MSSVGRETTPLCTVRNFLNAKGQGIPNGGFSYHSLDDQKKGKIDEKYQNGRIQNGMNLPNGNANLPANGTVGGTKLQNGATNNSFFHHDGSYKKLENEKHTEEDSIEFDFSTSSLVESETDAVVECTKNKS